jgi:hypothetical protein
MLLKKFILLFAACLLVSVSSEAREQRIIVGWVEKVTVNDVGVTYKGKLDTGAQTSSIRADIIKIEKKNRKKKKKGRVLFSIEGEEKKKKTLEREIVRWVRIKKKEGGFLRRPVVMMDLCVAGVLIKSEVNLASREDFIYPLLIGRNSLSRGNIAVDPGKTFTSGAGCDKD